MPKGRTRGKAAGTATAPEMRMDTGTGTVLGMGMGHPLAGGMDLLDGGILTNSGMIRECHNQPMDTMSGQGSALHPTLR